MNLATHNLAGFKVTKDDGKTIFHRVPIFAECARGEWNFDGAWMAEAVAAAKLQERDGYFPPLHTRHHEPATEQTNAVESVGVFRILEAGPLTFKGNRITAIFADLIVTDDWMAEELGRMKYPYRSVEIFEPDGPPKINGLALLDHEAPYLELPMLLAGEVEDRRSEQRDGLEVAGAINNSFSLNYSHKEGHPVIGSKSCGEKAVLLFKFSDEETMQTKQTKKPVAKAKPVNFADDEKPKEEENMEGDEAAPVLDIAAVCAAIENKTVSVGDMDLIIAAIQAANYAEEEVKEEVEEEPAPAAVPGAEIMSGKGNVALNFAALKGENDALKARLDVRDATDKRNADVKLAMKRLEGKPLGSDLEKNLIAFHTEAGGNESLFKAYVDSMAKNAGHFPAESDGANFAAQPKTPASAMAFQSLGGEAVDKATSFARQYGQMSGIRASEESYVRINMKHLGYELEATN